MNNLSKYLLKLRNDIFKLLPMREIEINLNEEKHISEYLFSLIVNATGATKTYENLNEEKNFIYVLNNLNYLRCNLNIEFPKWRNIVLNCTRNINDLKEKFNKEGK